MSEDDPRHGTNAGAVQHWKDAEKPCTPCAEAAYRDRKQRRHEKATGRPRRVPARGYQRRARALGAIGYSHDQIARMLGTHSGSHSNRLRGQWVTRRTHEAMVDLYERLSMTPNPAADIRTLKVARRNGWAPPLAWDDIDHDEHPHVEREQPYRPSAEVVAEYEWLTSLGESHEQALAALGITGDGLRAARKRTRRQESEAA